ncbi:integral membrane protein [Echinococcus granulosus]|uniref:Integral membrane protein n=1 Tax=Echinococcus granulosus TaxID=6210 RepID=W6UU51_ECHGR|nr:integral membrane protein [Echinococcus granulosus]EUB64171.1 integral membrane protein [Echinococcus granulosus]
MVLTCGEQCLRILLVVCNLFVFLFGCICTGFAAYTLAKVREYTSDQGALIVPAFILTLVLLILILGFLGCCGAWKLNSCCLKTYAIIITILIIIEVICGILILVYHDKGKDFIAKFLRQCIREAEVPGNTDMEDMMRNLQEKMDPQIGRTQAITAPDLTTPYPSSRHSSSGQGCADAIYEYLRSHAIVVGVTAIVLSIVEIGAVFAACCLAGKRSA